MNRSQLDYLKVASAELSLENPPGQPRQYPRLKTPGTPNPPPPTPTQPSPISSPPVPRNPHMRYDRVDTKTDNQMAIMKEIGYHQHNPEHITLCQNKAE